VGGARYSSKVKLGALESFLGKYSRLSLPALVATIRRDLKVCPHLIISAYDRDRNRAEFFRSDTGSRSASAIGPATPDPEASLDPQFPQILHASTVGLGDDFHPPPRIGNSRFCEGGAAGFCNPVLAAVTEAFANKEDPRDIRVLSIGSGTIQPPTPRISVLTNPPEVATFIAHVMLGQDMPHAAKHPVSGNVVRMSPVAHIKPKDTRGAPEGLSESQFQRLAGLEIHAVEQEQIELIQDLGNRWVDGKVWNQPIRPSRDYTCEIGQPTFAAARDAWHNLTK
jgi:uncharacterized protein